MTTSHVHIAVSGINAADNPGPGVSIIRAIRESGEFAGTITGLAYDPLDPGIYMDGVCDRAFLMPYPSEGMDTLLERIKEIHASRPLDVLIPSLDSEIEAFLKMEPALDQMGIRTYLPSLSGLKARAKAAFHRLSEKGVTVPKGMAVHDKANIPDLDKVFEFPVMVKGQFYEAYLARSPMEVEHHFHRLSVKWGLPVVVQEFIEGDEYDVTALGDGKGNIIGAVPMKKMQLTAQGKAWGGITVSDPDMSRFIADIARKLKWRGPCEMEIIKAKRGGDHFLMEMNPRFPAWCYLCVGAGQNLPWATVRLALGEDVRVFPPPKVGILFLRSSMDHIYSLSDYQAMTTIGRVDRTQR